MILAIYWGECLAALTISNNRMLIFAVRRNYPREEEGSPSHSNGVDL
jgi:hypothetical protein